MHVPIAIDYKCIINAIELNLSYVQYNCSQKANKIK